MDLEERTNEFLSWYDKAKPGDWHTYHIGDWLHDSLATEYVRKTVWNYACQGKVYLFTKRDKELPGMIFFKAQKASRIIPKLNPGRVIDTSRRQRG